MQKKWTRKRGSGFSVPGEWRRSDRWEGQRAVDHNLCGISYPSPMVLVWPWCYNVVWQFCIIWSICGFGFNNNFAVRFGFGEFHARLWSFVEIPTFLVKQHADLMSFWYISPSGWILKVCMQFRDVCAENWNFVINGWFSEFVFRRVWFWWRFLRSFIPWNILEEAFACFQLEAEGRCVKQLLSFAVFFVSREVGTV